MTFLFIDIKSLALFLVSFLLIIVAGSLATSMMKSKKSVKESCERYADETEAEDAIATNARVISKRTAKEYSDSSDDPDCRSVFFVEFETEDGEQFEYEVPESVYASVEVGYTSTLVTVEDRFIAFEDGEEI